MPFIDIYLTQVVKESFQSLGFEAEESMCWVKTSDRPDLSDYQCSGALALGKKTNRNPQDLALLLKENLTPVLAGVDVSIAGPGFLNFTLSCDFLFRHFDTTSPIVPNQSLEKTIFDYGGPNVAKPMHVGHLRSSIIGESLKRLFRYKGHKVIADIHLGDWGTQMGMLIVALKQKRPDLPYFDKNFHGPYPDYSPVSLEDLQEIYPIISAACKEDESLATEARYATYELQQGRPGYRALWQHFVDISVADMRKNFDRLNVSFDHWFGESRYQDKIPSLIQQFQEKGAVESSDGALIINVADFSDKKEMPPLILQKSDGGFLYATTDLATIDERIHVFKAERIIYVVDGRQRLHFEQVFRAAEKLGYKVRTDFIGFGTMNGPDNKPFKTRSGGAMRLEELIDTLKEEAIKRMLENKSLDNFSVEEQKSIAERVGVAALKFADLQHNPVQNYQFDLKKFMSFEGKTGPYLLYALVRIRSILEKSDQATTLPDSLGLLPVERLLFLKTMQAEEAFEKAYKNLAPHLICDYAFDLAQIFSRFYQECNVINENNQDKKAIRLFLCKQAFQKLSLALNLLGIEPVERM
ncbi:MAG: arginine--tRNA ligase [Alphaproteobacteria bacterium]